MAARPRAAISWSGGKDCCAALLHVRSELDFVAALTMVDEEGRRSRSHGTRVELLAEQVRALGLAHVTRPCDWPSYEEEFANGLRDLKAHDVSHVVFGDLLYPEHRAWAERLARRAGLEAVEPLWGHPTPDVVERFMEQGGRALIVTVNERWLDQSWLGTELTPGVVRRLVERGVDPCGENGEYHTFVIDSPAFSRPVEVRRGEVVHVRGCWALDLLQRDGAGSPHAETNP